MSADAKKRAVNEECFFCDGPHAMPLDESAPARLALTLEASRTALFGKADATLASHMREVERRVIGQALEMFNGNRTHAAKALGITREGLHKKLRAHGIPKRRGTAG